MARLLAGRGDTVVLGAHDVDAGRRLAAELRETPGDVHPVALVTDPATPAVEKTMVHNMVRSDHVLVGVRFAIQH